MGEHIEVVISGQKHPLTPTLDALRVVNRYKGGLVEIQTAISKVDSEAIALVIAAGMGMKTSEQFDGVEQSIYKEGVRTFVEPASKFIVRLANGGKDPDDSEKKDAKPGNGASG